MKKENGKKRAAAYAAAFAAALLLLLGIGIAYAASMQPAVPARCSVMPALSIDKSAIAAIAGRLATVRISVTGTQGASCGSQSYGVDFTNGYSGKEMVFAIKGVLDRNVFSLKPGETKNFTGMIGVPPGTEPGNYTIQLTAYLEADHWEQVSKNAVLAVKPVLGSDAYWKTDLVVGWNNIPNIDGLGVYGCPDINTGYRYSPYKGDYIVLNRYGSQFVPAPFEPNIENERFGALFVFSRQKCSLESRVPAEAFDKSEISIREGQLLSIPPEWHNATVGSILKQCIAHSGNANFQLDAKIWDAGNQKWIPAGEDEHLKNGQALRLIPNAECTLDMQKGLD